jgi:hypothetical protein
MEARLTYAIKFEKDMDKAVGFHRDVLGPPLKFQSPKWSEFSTGSVTLALHPASDKNPAGRVELGFATKNLQEIYSNRQTNSIKFTSEPKSVHGVLLAGFEDGEGTQCGLSDE